MPDSARAAVVEQHILECSVRLPAGGAVTGWAACRVWGANFFDGVESDGRTPIPVMLAIGPRGRIRGDVQVSLTYDRLDPDETVVAHGIAITTRERATFDEMRRTNDLREAVVAVEMAIAAELTSLLRMNRYAESRSGWNRVGHARLALGLSSEHSWSPNETRLRLVVVLDAGLADLHVNCPITDRAGRLLGIADLLDAEAGLVIEYDGADHRGAKRHNRDVRKETDLRRVGLEVTRVTSLDLLDHSVVVERVLEARGRARFAAESQRPWIPRPQVDDVEETLQHRELLEERMRSW